MPTREKYNALKKIIRDRYAFYSKTRAISRDNFTQGKHYPIRGKFN